MGAAIDPRECSAEPLGAVHRPSGRWPVASRAQSGMARILGQPLGAGGRRLRRGGRESGRHEAASFLHSTVYIALLVCAFGLANPEPETFALGLTHGLMWIAMSLACIVAARNHVIPFWLAVTVAVLGGLGPFAGSAGFLI